MLWDQRLGRELFLVLAKVLTPVHPSLKLFNVPLKPPGALPRSLRGTLITLVKYPPDVSRELFLVPVHTTQSPKNSRHLIADNPKVALCYHLQVQNRALCPL